MKYKQKIIPHAYTEQWANLSTQEVSRKILTIYNNKYKNQIKVKNLDLEIIVEFRRKGGNKTAYGGNIYPKKACLIDILDDIIKYAVYNNFGYRKLTDPKDVIGYLNFKAKVMIDNKLNNIHLVLQFNKDGKFYYTIEVNKISRQVY